MESSYYAVRRRTWTSTWTRSRTGVVRTPSRTSTRCSKTKRILFKEMTLKVCKVNLETNCKPQVCGVLLAGYEAALKRGCFDPDCVHTSQWYWSLEEHIGMWKKRAAVHLGRAFGAEAWGPKPPNTYRVCLKSELLTLRLRRRSLPTWQGSGHTTRRRAPTWRRRGWGGNLPNTQWWGNLPIT